METRTSYRPSNIADDRSENADGQPSAEEFARRLRERTGEQGISRSNLMNALEIRKQTFAGYWNGERLPPAHVLLQMAEQLDVSPKWLLTGSNDSDSRARGRFPAPRQERVADSGGDTVEIVEIDLRYGMGATYLDEAPDVQARTFSRAWLRNFTDSPPEELFWARGQGNSMEPTIGEGAIVLIDRRQQSPRMADLIWAFAFGDIGMLKRLRPMPNGSVKILSDNQSVPPEIAHDGELHIIGRVVAVVKKL